MWQSLRSTLQGAALGLHGGDAKGRWENLSHSAWPGVVTMAVSQQSVEIIRCAGSRLRIRVPTLPLGLWGGMSDGRSCFFYSI